MKLSILFPKISGNRISYEIASTENFGCLMTICLACGSPTKIGEISEILSSDELSQFNSFSSEKRRLHFLLGRYSAKKALLSQLNGRSEDLRSVAVGNPESMHDINIYAGIFGQPIFENPGINSDLSISHNGLFGGAVVFDRKFPCGFDLQRLNESKRDVLQKYISPDELNSDCLSDLITAWSFKESFSKVLRCGLTVPLNLLSLINFRKNNNERFCDFRNFPKFSGYAQVFDDMVLSIVFPKQ